MKRDQQQDKPERKRCEHNWRDTRITENGRVVRECVPTTEKPVGCYAFSTERGL